MVSFLCQLHIFVFLLVGANGYQTNQRLLKHHHHFHHRYNPPKKRLYRYAKAVDYDELLEWQEENQINNIIQKNQAMEAVNTVTLVTTSNAGVGGYGGVGGRAGLIRFNAHFQIKWPTHASRAGAVDVFIQEDAGGDKWFDFVWKDWIKRFNKQTFNGHYDGYKNQILNFRNQIKDALIQDTGGGADLNCYDNIGSATPKSDLDFTFIRWDVANRVVRWIGNFYKECKRIMGNYPAKAFDMNFYIATVQASRKPTTTATNPIKQRNCLATIPQNVKDKFFHQIDDQNNVEYQLWAFGDHYTGANAALWKKRDRYLQYYLMRKRFKSSTPLTAPFALKNLLKTSEVFYNIIDRFAARAVDGHEATNEEILYMHALLMWMNFHSDESYISNVALQDIWFTVLSFEEKKMATGVGVGGALLDRPWGGGAFGWPHLGPRPTWHVNYMPNNDNKLPQLLALDQFAFIKKYKIEAEGHMFSGSDEAQKKKRIIYFVDRISKYVKRIGQFLAVYLENWDDNGQESGGIQWNQRKQFRAFYPLMTLYARFIRGKVAESRIFDEYDNHDAAAVLVIGDPTLHLARRGAQVIYDTMDTSGIHKQDTPKKIWDTFFQPIVGFNAQNRNDDTGFCQLFNGLVSLDKNKLEAGMDAILQKVESKITLFGGDTGVFVCKNADRPDAAVAGVAPTVTLGGRTYNRVQYDRQCPRRSNIAETIETSAMNPWLKHHAQVDNAHKWVI
eukprot:255612_1